MKQFELLNEGFWSGFKSVAKGAAKLGQQVAKVAAPEIYNPIAGAANWVKDVNQKIIKATTQESQYIINKLMNQGYTLTSNSAVNKLQMKPGDEKQLYQVSVQIRPEFLPQGAENPVKQFMVDGDGNIVRDLTAKDASLGGNKPRKQKKQKVLHNPPATHNKPKQSP